MAGTDRICKRLLRVYAGPEVHWVGDGFPVRTVMSHHAMGDAISPFLLLDYASPTEIPPSPEPRGVDAHPHKGFETVTIVYQGALEHRDSAGHSGRIGQGDVQWMTAGAGIVHEEKHERAFAKSGGNLQMAQLWVNLPARDKQTPPSYQTLLSASIPEAAMEGGGTARIIAGTLRGARGPARTHTPINVWDLRLPAGAEEELETPAGHNTLLFVLSGRVALGDSEEAGEAELALFSRDGDRIRLRAESDSVLLALTGEPIEEPVAAYGPFVMNTQAEIADAIRDYQVGRMGRLSPQ